MAKESMLYWAPLEHYPEEPDWPSRRAEPPHVYDRLANALLMGGGSIALFGLLSAVATGCTALEIGGPWSEVWTAGFAVSGALIALGLVASLLGDRRDKRVQRRAREEFDRG